MKEKGYYEHQYMQSLQYWKQQWNVLQKRKKHVESIHSVNKDINAFVELYKNAKYEKTDDTLLTEVPFAIKSNISLKGEILSCASKILEHFISPIHATAVKQLLEAGAVPLGRTNMDEFGMGSDTTHSIYGRTRNPWDLDYSPGGSSGGSAAAVASGCVPFALGSDTGGSVRQPAMFCGVWGLKPTYGSVSRYGLVAYSSSLDVIGIIAEHPKWLRDVFSVIRVQTATEDSDARDPNDTSSFYPFSRPSPKAKRIGICISNKDIEVDKSIQNAIKRTKKIYESLGYETVDIDLPFVKYSPAVYLNLSTAEASANLARFDGIRYGDRGGFAENREQLVRNARNSGLGEEVKLRILTGAFVLRSGFQDKYYSIAQKLRVHIRSEILKMFKTVDLIVSPVSPKPVFRFDDDSMDEFQQKLCDAYSVIANITGIPAVSAPICFDDMPISVQIMAPHYGEERLFSFLDATSGYFEHKWSPYAHTMHSLTERKCNGYT